MLFGCLAFYRTNVCCVLSSCALPKRHIGNKKDAQRRELSRHRSRICLSEEQRDLLSKIAIRGVGKQIAQRSLCNSLVLLLL